MALLDLYFAHGLVEGLELALQHPRDALADLADFGLEHRSQALLQQRLYYLPRHALHHPQHLLLELLLLEVVLLYLHARRVERAAVPAHQQLHLLELVRFAAERLSLALALFLHALPVGLGVNVRLQRHHFGCPLLLLLLLSPYSLLRPAYSLLHCAQCLLLQVCPCLLLQVCACLLLQVCPCLLLQVCPCLPQCLLLVLCGALFFPLLQSTLDNVVAELLNILCVPGYLGVDNVFLML